MIAVAKCVAHVQIITYNAFLYTVEPLLADTPNSGHLPYNGQYAMYQLLFPYIPYFKKLPNSGHIHMYTNKMYKVF